MNLNKILAELRAELAAVTEAIAVLDRLARTRGRLRGRPPLFLIGTRDGSGVRKRRPFSDETRRKMAAAQKRRWAAYRKAKKQSESE
jgi:hypothetical protein